MNKTLEKDKNQIADLLKKVTEQAAEFVDSIDSCFTTSSQTTPQRLNKIGMVFMSPTVFSGIKAIRAVFVNWRTMQKDIELAYKQMVKLV